MIWSAGAAESWTESVVYWSFTRPICGWRTLPKGYLGQCISLHDDCFQSSPPPFMSKGACFNTQLVLLHERHVGVLWYLQVLPLLFLLDTGVHRPALACLVNFTCAWLQRGYLCLSTAQFSIDDDFYFIFFRRKISLELNSYDQKFVL